MTERLRGAKLETATPVLELAPDGAPRLFNRELSWLAFNRRVLEESINPAHPLLERLRFLSISASNLDEFIMVRVAGIKAHQLQEIEETSTDGLTPTQQLEAIEASSSVLVAQQQEQWALLSAQLAERGLIVVDDAQGAAAWRSSIAKIFAEQIFPVLTPQALDPAHPFPFIPNKGLAVIFELEAPGGGGMVRELVMVPQALPRFFRVPGRRAVYISIDALIVQFADQLFPGFALRHAGRFRVLRDSDIEVEEEAEDLVRYFRSAIRRRRRGRIVTLEVDSATPEPLQQELLRQVERDKPDVQLHDGLVGLADLAEIVAEDRPDLKFPPYTPRLPERIREHGGDCFAAIREKDILVHHPYESFDVVLSFLRQAAADPDVVAIKQTLYRAGDQSPVIKALIEAAEAGKSVTAVVELKARFDEEQNLHWAAQLERAGVQVVYGFIEWKTHAKVSMVVRREGSRYRTYCHFGTGNYHPVTARIYTDFSYFTADARCGRDAAQLFNFITGYVTPQQLERLTISPSGLRAKLTDLIDAEIANARAGLPAAIWAKMNSLVDSRIINKLYEASSAGVQIELIVRGICCLRPGVAGLSDNISVKSVVGRFLEHSRVFAFANGAAMPHAKALLFISSADWMTRNFDRRVEYLMPIDNPTVHNQLLQQVLVANLLDNEQSWRLRSDGSYVRQSSEDTPFNLHRYFMDNPSLSGRGQALAKRKDVPTLKLIARRG